MSELDDFFAKKDKTKKNKKKGTTNNDLTKKFEPKSGDKSKEKKNNFANLDNAEWNDFADEDPDYSGLKIQTLSIKDKEEEQKEEEESAKRELQSDVPWKVEDAENNESRPEPEKHVIFSIFRQGPRINDKAEFPNLATMTEGDDQPGNYASKGGESISTGNKYSVLRNNAN